MQENIHSGNSDTALFTEILSEIVPGIPLAAASALGNSAEPRSFRAGDLIVCEGKLSEGIFLLSSGRVQASMSAGDVVSKREVNLHQIVAPAVLGLADTTLAQPSTLSLSALTAVETSFIPRAEFLRVLRDFPEAGLAFSQLIADELAHTYSHLSQLRSSATWGNSSVLVM